MRKFGLIGFPLTHSFSKKFFGEKFERENIKDCMYDLYEIEDVNDIHKIVESSPQLEGLNVTIPHKKNIIPFLSSLDSSALNVGAVNVIKIEDGVLKGYNSDYYGFRESLLGFAGKEISQLNALILGNGGAANAVKAVLADLHVPFINVSRTATSNNISYEELSNSQLMDSHKLIINTTPLGMYPNIESFPFIPYKKLNSTHFLFDLVYNPLETIFLLKGKSVGAKTISGLEMLHLQAEKAWEIWNS